MENTVFLSTLLVSEQAAGCHLWESLSLLTTGASGLREAQTLPFDGRRLVMAVGEGLHARFDSNRCKRGKSQSTCVTLKKAHSLGPNCII